MIDPVWVSYAGAVTGSIGAVTGIAGAILGYVGYRRTGDLKALDMRLELRKTENSLRALISGLPKLIRDADTSRTATMAATGRLRSGQHEAWNSECQRDLDAVQDLDEQLPEEEHDYRKLDHAELESRLVLIADLMSKADALQRKYVAALSADDVERQRIREAAETRFNNVIRDSRRGETH